MPTSIFVADMKSTKTMRYGGADVLTYELHYPQFAGYTSMAGLDRINTLYRQQTQTRAASIEANYYTDAIAEYSQRNGENFSPYEFLQTFEMVYGQDCLISLYRDQYQYTGGAHGGTTRFGDNWNARTGLALALSALFPARDDYEARIKAGVAEQIRRDPTPYFDDAVPLSAQLFDARNFYFSPTSLAIFYQQYEIAPYSTGIPTFVFPFAEIGAALPRC